MKILRSHYVQKKGAPGEIIHKDEKSCIVGCKTDAISLVEVQLEGKRRMSGKDFMNGYNGRGMLQ